MADGRPLTPDICPDDMRQRCKDAALRLKGGGWDFMIAASEIVDARLYLQWGFRSAAAWFRTDLPAYSANSHHYVAMGRFIRSLPDDGARKPWLAEDPWCVIAGQRLLKSDPDALLAKLQSGATYAQVRREVATALPDQHLEDEFRTIKLTVSKPVYELWEKACHRARYESCVATPTDDDVITALSIAMVNEPLHVPDNGFSAPEWHAFVHSGAVQCRNCGSLDRTQLDFHHVVARSAGGGEGPQVPLCRKCHTEIQPRWREWAVEQGFEVD